MEDACNRDGGRLFDLHDWIWGSVHIRSVSHAHDGRDRMGSRDVCFGDSDPKFVVVIYDASCLDTR